MFFYLPYFGFAGAMLYDFHSPAFWLGRMFVVAILCLDFLDVSGTDRPNVAPGNRHSDKSNLSIFDDGLNPRTAYHEHLGPFNLMGAQS